MRDEILRLCSVTKASEAGEGEPALDHLNLRVFRGEILGVFQMNTVGREALIQLLQQNVPLKQGLVFWEGTLVNSHEHSDGSRNPVFVIEEGSGLIPGLTVLQNVFIKGSAAQKAWIRQNALSRRLGATLRAMGLEAEPSMPIRALSNSSKRGIELLRAVEAGAKLIVLENISNFLTQREQEEFGNYVRYFRDRGISFLHLSTNREELLALCGSIALMQDGTILKFRPAAEFREDVWDAALRQNITQAPGMPSRQTSRSVLTFRGVTTERLSGLDFSAVPGECLLVVDESQEEIHEIFTLLGSRKPPAGGEILLAGRRLSETAGGAAAASLCLVAAHPSETMVCEELSYLENLSISVNRKTGAFYRSARVLESILREYEPLIGPEIHAPSLRGVGPRARYDLVYYRIHLMNPKLAVIVQPLGNCDVALRRHILRLLQMLKGRGIALLLLSGSSFELSAVADRILFTSGGRVGKVSIPSSERKMK